MEEHEERWITWIVPKEYCVRYLFLLFGVLILLPLITGLTYKVNGYILNIIWADIMFYIWYKRRKIKEKELAQKRRRDKYLKDNK